MNVIDNIVHIDMLVKDMKGMPQANTKTTHHFSDGMYVRELFIPKDTYIIGKVHKTNHLNIILKGRCYVKTPTREFEVVAPCTFESFAGEQKVVYTYEDTIWSNVHKTTETDLAKIEAECVSDEYDKQLITTLLEGLGGQQCLGD